MSLSRKHLIATLAKSADAAGSRKWSQVLNGGDQNRADRRRLRELRRRQAMQAYGDDFEVAFESLEGESFDTR